MSTSNKALHRPQNDFKLPGMEISSWDCWKSQSQPTSLLYTLLLLERAQCIGYQLNLAEQLSNACHNQGYAKLPHFIYKGFNANLQKKKNYNKETQNQPKCGYLRRDLLPTCIKCWIFIHNSIRHHCPSSSSLISVSVHFLFISCSFVHFVLFPLWWMTCHFVFVLCSLWLV